MTGLRALTKAGTTDLLYLRDQDARIWRNQAGNLFHRDCFDCKRESRQSPVITSLFGSSLARV